MTKQFTIRSHIDTHYDNKWIISKRTYLKQKIMPLDIPWQERASFLEKGWNQELQACQGEKGEIQMLYNNLMVPKEQGGLGSQPKSTKWVFKYPDAFQYPHATIQNFWYRGEGFVFGQAPSFNGSAALKRVDG